MKKNLLSTLASLVVIVALALIANAIIKPRFNTSRENPYDLKLDSLGLIAPENYCATTTQVMVLPLPHPKAIATDTDNNVYISGDNRILKVTLNGAKLAEFSTPSTATAMATNQQQQLFAAFETHIAVYSSNGELIEQWPNFNKRTYITSLATSNDRLFAADADDALVYEYTMNGGFVRTYGNKKDKDAVTSFILPSYFFEVAIAPDQSLWVSNNGKHKLVNFNADGSLREYWGETSAGLHGFSGCCNPSHIAILQDGSFITAEKGLVRIKRYSATGEFECALAGPDHFRPGALGLDIALTTDNQVLVLEPDASQIHIFTFQTKRHE
jgi:hypothetical protein